LHDDNIDTLTQCHLKNGEENWLNYIDKINLAYSCHLILLYNLPDLVLYRKVIIEFSVEPQGNHRENAFDKWKEIGFSGLLVQCSCLN